MSWKRWPRDPGGCGRPVRAVKGATVGYLCFGAYVATIWLANWAVLTFGVVPVWPGVAAPAGVLFAGLALTLRDLVQDELGRRWTVGAILLGALLSGLLSGPLALASGAAFLVSEASDMAVYTPLKERGRWLWGIAASNTVGLVIDSALFLWLAFGSLDFLAGQIVGKTEVTVLTVALLAAWRARGLLPRHASA